MTNLINRTICYLTKHKLPNICSDIVIPLDIKIYSDPYTGQDYLYCLRCKAYLPTWQID